MGCPIQTLQSGGRDLQISVCSGYELTADLDFDTDGDGDVDADDDYWNSGAGWLPLTTCRSPTPASPPPSRATGTSSTTVHEHHHLLQHELQETGGVVQPHGRDAVIRNLGLTTST